MFERILRFVLHRPLWVIAVFVAVTASAAYVHGRDGRFDFSFHKMAPRSTEAYATWVRYVEMFGLDDNIYLIAFEDGDLLSPASLDRIRSITGRIEKLEHTESVNSLTNVKDIRGTDEGLDVSEFVEGPAEGTAEKRELMERLTRDPITLGNLISADGLTTAIVGRTTEGTTDPVERVVYFEQVEAILDEVAPGTAFYIAGIPYMDNTVMRHMMRDTNIFLPALALVFGLSLWAAFGHFRMIWMPLVPICIAAVTTLGAITSLGYTMSLLTGQGFLSTLIIVIGLSDGVHLLNRYAECLAEDGSDRRAALMSAMRHVGVACFLTSLTTAIGFLALALADIPTVQEFGLFGALGIVLAYLGAVILLPACIVVTERFSAADPRPARSSQPVIRVLSGATSLVTRYPRAIALGAVALLLVSAAAASRIRVDNRFTEGMYESDPSVVSLRFLEQRLSGSAPLEIVVEGDRPDAIKDPRVLEAMEYVAEGLEALPTITKVHSPVPFLKKMNMAMHEGREEAFAIPGTPETVAQYLLLFEMAGGDNEFDRLVTYDYSVARMTAFLIDSPPEDYETIIARFHELIEGRFPPGIRVYESGGEPLFYTVTNRLIGTLIRSLYLAMPVAFVILAIAFRSLRMAMLGVLPNLLPITVGLGLLGAVDLSLRFTTVIAFPVAFGLAIDDTIHFLARYRAERENGAGRDEAIGVTMRTAGRAMVFTSLFLIAGYTVTMTSSFLGVTHMAVVVITILVAALLGDLLLLPALIVWFGDGMDARPADRSERLAA